MPCSEAHGWTKTNITYFFLSTGVRKSNASSCLNIRRKIVLHKFVSSLWLLFLLGYSDSAMEGSGGLDALFFRKCYNVTIYM